MNPKTDNWLKRSYRMLALPCHEASRLISRALDEPLPLGERLALRLHLWICRLCRRYQRQLRVVRKAMQRLPDRVLNRPADLQLPEPTRTRIKAVLRDTSTSEDS